jgi:cytochrome P450
MDAVVAESLRIRPPTPLTVRHAAARDELPSGAGVRRGTKILISPLVLHHDPELFPDPGRFAPDRFSESERKRRPRFHYLPFGAGSRSCIGRALALLETTVVTGVVVERFELEPVGAGPEQLAPAPPRPAVPVTVRLTRRASAQRFAQRQHAAG